MAKKINIIFGGGKRRSPGGPVKPKKRITARQRAARQRNIEVARRAKKKSAQFEGGPAKLKKTRGSTSGGQIVKDTAGIRMKVVGGQNKLNSLIKVKYYAGKGQYKTGWIKNPGGLK